jgi:hypothetical protein
LQKYALFILSQGRHVGHREMAVTKGIYS